MVPLAAARARAGKTPPKLAAASGLRSLFNQVPREVLSRSSARALRLCRHRDVGAVQLLRHASPARFLPHPALPLLRRRELPDLRRLHGAGLHVADRRRRHLRPVARRPEGDHPRRGAARPRSFRNGDRGTARGADRGRRGGAAGALRPPVLPLPRAHHRRRRVPQDQRIGPGGSALPGRRRPARRRVHRVLHVLQPVAPWHRSSAAGSARSTAGSTGSASRVSG
jgi:hypothetical protein